MPTCVTHQTPVYYPPLEMTMAISSLSLGGAEKIVVDWANRQPAGFPIHLIVLRDRSAEWPVPSNVRVTRLESGPLYEQFLHISTAAERRIAQLRYLGGLFDRSLATPICLCHLMTRTERAALGEHGVVCVPVLHNARSGWGESVEQLAGTSRVIAVSQNCADELVADGYTGNISVIRHIPAPRRFDSGIRAVARAAWRIPAGAQLIGMIGAVKSQKDYPRALAILEELQRRCDTWLVILGGPVNTTEGRVVWKEVVDAVEHLGLRKRVAMTGFIPDASRYLPALDLLLNTSRFEGLSIATLEALQAGLPVVASRVGGQGELTSAGLSLVEADSAPSVWADVILVRIGKRYQTPAWQHAPTFRLWSLAALAHGPAPGGGRLMLVTANLNSGGAQRSLINLASAMNGRLDLIVSVAGLSTSNVFQRELESAGVRVIAATHSTLSFNNAEAILAQAAVLNVTCICFWNLDPKVKLLVTKSLAYSSIHLIDVSPGGYCLDSLDDTAEFGELIAFTPKDYYARLNCLVHKYYAPSPLGLRFEPLIIPNGVPLAQRRKVCYDLDASPQVVVNGRITPTKYILEIIAAMRLVRRHFRQAELHLLGGSEELQDEYRAAVDALINEDGGLTVIHGHRADTPERLWQYDLQVTIGANQGCPNATLEALIAGLPVIANRDGGTEEQIIHRETGLLIESRSPEEISRAIFLLLSDRDLARRLAQNGQSHAERTFSMMRMTSSYEHLFMEHGVRAAKETNGDDDQFWTGLKKGEYLEKGDIYEYHV